MLTLAAIEMAGPVYGDRIEHAAIADPAAIEWMKTLGIIIVTQPNFISERVDAYLKDVPETEHENLWRLKAFAAAGLRLAAGSDAPFGDLNPWAAMQSAVNRGAAPRTVEVGGLADLVVLDRPWHQARENLGDVKVSASWIDGELVYNRVD